MKDRKLVAVLACRNRGSRLYGKPLQRLDIQTGWHILDQCIANIQSLSSISEIILAVSEGDDNISFLDYAKSRHLRCIVGDQTDVLKRLITGLNLAGGTDLFRVTTESPYLYWQSVPQAWETHKVNTNDATFMDGVVDGCGFELITAEALELSWSQGDSRHRSEMCSLFVRENPLRFKIEKLPFPPKFARRDLRLTVDYPEDLIVCRNVYEKFKGKIMDISYSLEEMINYLDDRDDLRKLILPFAEAGYESMYL